MHLSFCIASQEALLKHGWEGKRRCDSAWCCRLPLHPKSWCVFAVLYLGSPVCAFVKWKTLELPTRFEQHRLLLSKRNVRKPLFEQAGVLTR